MQINIFCSIFFLSIINSVLEFLPISSTLHIKTIFNFFNFCNLELFLIFSQLGITLTLIIFYKKCIFDIIKKFFCKKDTRIFIYKLIFLCFFSCFVGAIIKLLLIPIINSGVIVIFSLIILGIIMIFIEKDSIYKDNLNIVDNFKSIGLKENIFIGIVQGLSVINGVSRSGVTICACLFKKIPKETAIYYSFFISIPINLASCFFDIYKNKNLLCDSNYIYILYTFLFSFIFSLIFIKKVLFYLNRINFKYFGYYRIIIAILMFLIYKNVWGF